MTRLLIDTWDAEYGGSFEAFDLEAEASQTSASPIEDVPWEPVPGAMTGHPRRIGFLDGVRRIELRLFAEDGSVIAPALAGSWAVGVAWGGERSEVGPIRIGRSLVVAGGLSHPAMRMTIGNATLDFVAMSVTGTTSIDPIQGLQNAMRAAEAALAAELMTNDPPELLVLDGPLTYFAPGGLVVGMIKRQNRPYLRPEQAAILGALEVGRRTPIFLLGDQRLERFSWYLRIGARRPIDGTMTGIVRLETSVAAGLDAARVLANLTAGALPGFATEWGTDPRAPQNLYPVAQLERELHHRLGDRMIVRRAIESTLWGDNV
jgi:hypothetical protein